MQAVVLAGGLGTRLRPVLGDVPKPMAPLSGRPFLEYQLLYLKHAGITEVVLCVGYRAEVIEEYFGDGTRYGLKIVYSTEAAPLGTGGAIKLAAPLLRDSFFVLNGDSYAELDYRELERFQREHHALATLGLTRSDDARAYGSVVATQDGRVTAFREKAEQGGGAAAYISAGVYRFERAVLDFIPAKKAVSLETQTFPTMLTQGARLFGMAFEGYFIDIGTPAMYAQFEQDVTAGRVHVYSQ